MKWSCCTVSHRCSGPEQNYKSYFILLLYIKTCLRDPEDKREERGHYIAVNTAVKCACEACNCGLYFGS